MNTSILTWLITGASSGLGLALTRHALANGHKVIATSRNPSKSSDLVAEITRSGGRWWTLDVDDPQCGALVHDLESQGSRIDVLVNNAGWSMHGAAESFTEDETRRQLETTFFGPYRLVRAVVPYMRKRRRGVLVNMSSGASVHGRESMSIYAAGKAAMDSLFRVLAQEIEPFGVRTLTVQLGGLNTNFTKALQLSSTPFPEDYRGTNTELVARSLQGGEYKPDGDPLKVARVIYEIVVGEGIGRDKLKERVMFLGRDMCPKMDAEASNLSHEIEVFREVAESVSLDQHDRDL